MAGYSWLQKAAVLLASASSTLAYLPPITQKGANFVVSTTGDRFDIIGVDYQPGGSSAFTGTSDPLSDASTCLRDAVLMQKLGVNTIRVYNVANDLDHSECVSIFDYAGIYLLLDVNTGLSGEYMDRSDPASTYTLEYLEHIFGVVENFKNFNNVLGFFSGNELINDDATAANNPPYMRAVVRDLKNYIAAQASRTIPVGYSAADVADVLQETWAYMQCNNNDDNSNSSFFGLNDYEWCGDSTFTESGYDTLEVMFEDTAIPVFFSEYGCNAVEPRTFTEVAALYGDEMTVLSGGLVYEYTQESDDYGLVDVYSNATAELLADYVNLQTEIAAIDLTARETANVTAESLTIPNCTTITFNTTVFNATFDIPAIPSGGAALISSGVTSITPGSYVSVTATSVTQSVYSTNGALITGLVLEESSADADSTIASGSGTVSATSTSTSTSTTSAAGVPSRIPSTLSLYLTGVLVAMVGLLAVAL